MKKQKFDRIKPVVKFHPIYRQWVVYIPVKNKVWRPHSMTFFKTWSEAIRFALNPKESLKSLTVMPKRRKRA